MAKTLTTQSHLFPYSGTHNWEDGDGMATRIAYDLPRMLNNLWAYCNRRVQYMQAAATVPPGLISITVPAASTEKYITQVPILVPLYARSMNYMVGVRAKGAGTAITVDTLKAYISRVPYRGAATLDTAGLSPDKVSLSSSVSIATSGTVYKVIGPAIFYFNVLPPPVTALDQDDLAWLVFTLTGSGGIEGTSMGIEDCTVWYDME